MRIHALRHANIATRNAAIALGARRPRARFALGEQ
jgi:hypothetical protein